MSYSDASARNSDQEFRNRAIMCAREQGAVYAADADQSVAALGRGCVAGEQADFDALIAQVSVAPVGGDLDEDATLLGAVQSVWPSVAAARYPGTPA